MARKLIVRLISIVERKHDMFLELNNALLVPLTVCAARMEIDQHHPGWELALPPSDETAETRTFTTHVVFTSPFANNPIVHVGLCGFDIDNRDSARLSVRAEGISPTGFDLHIITWLNSRVYKAEVSWIALGHQLTQ
jgi:H-type lectin domain